MMYFKLSCHGLGDIPNLLPIKLQSSAEYAGRRALVGYSALVMASIRVVLIRPCGLDDIAIFYALSLQFVYENVTDVLQIIQGILISPGYPLC